MAVSDNVKRGSIEIVILTLLKESDMYGYQLSQEMKLRSKGRYSLLESSMYPSLYRMLDKGLISDRQEKVGKRRVRVYYHLEPAGEEYLEKAKEEYLSLTFGVLDILGVKKTTEDDDER